MSDTYNVDLVANSTWVDVTTVYPAMTSVNSYVANQGPGNIKVAYSSNAVAPAGGALIVTAGDQWGGTAAHVWVRGLNGNATYTVGLV